MTFEEQEAEPSRSPAVDEVLRKIERNLLLYQHIEHLLKALMSNSRLQGPAGELRGIHERRAAANLRQLAKPGLRSASRSRPTAFIERHQMEMEAVVEARNDLIHHFLPRWNPASE